MTFFKRAVEVEDLFEDKLGYFGFFGKQMSRKRFLFF